MDPSTQQLGVCPRQRDATASQVTVQSSNVSFTAQVGETVMDAAERNGLSWPTICGGKVDCTRCFMEVIDGAENLSPMDAAEFEALERVRWRGQPHPEERLACCAEVTGDIVVRRRSVRFRSEGEVA